ncbi:hypothetical protein C0Q91_31050 [Streptomyces albidoflavus]|uniref:Uncharacterized protein n=1 Tax=Streptomyces albidoflavus TaxID=1886 RepID=A0AB37X4B4_9ACTN|nr:hypothetical protein C0Q91_31050 [Streptomyces albidoflavus]
MPDTPARRGAAGDDLYQRYMAAYDTHRDHPRTCPPCPGRPCAAGDRLLGSFERLQEAYLAWQRDRR